MCCIVSSCYFYIVGTCNVVKGTSHLPDVSVRQLLRLQGNGHWSTVTGVAGGLGVGTGGVVGDWRCHWGGGWGGCGVVLGVYVV